MKEKSTLMGPPYYAQGRSLRRTSISYDTKTPAYERPFSFSKQKRRWGKAIDWYDEGETEGQARFFSPSPEPASVKLLQKIRSINASLLYKAIASDGYFKSWKSAWDTRKEQRRLAREAIHEQLASEKTRRWTTREARRIQTAAEVVKRK